MGKTAIEHEPIAEGAQVEGEVVHTSTGTMRHRPVEKNRDEFYISPEQRKAYGIKDNETPYWAREGSKWEQYEFTDRQEQLEDEFGARTVFKSGEFDKIKRGYDLVLMAVPSEVFETRQSEIDQSSQAFEQDLRPDPEDEKIVRSHRDMFDRYDAKREQAMRDEHERNVRSGFVGGSSPTAGLSLMEAEALMRKKGVNIEEVQAQARRGGRHVQMDTEQFQRMITGDRESRRANRTSVAMGDSGFGRNPNSAVAQAARKSTGGAK